MDVNLSAPEMNKTRQPSRQVSTGMLAPSSVVAVCVRWKTALILQGVTQFVSHFQYLHFMQLLCENSCSLPKKTVYKRSFHSVNFRLYFQFRVNAGRKANIGSNIPSLTLNLKSLILTFPRTNSFHPNKSISICSLS